MQIDFKAQKKFQGGSTLEGYHPQSKVYTEYFQNFQQVAKGDVGQETEDDKFSCHQERLMTK